MNRPEAESSMLAPEFLKKLEALTFMSRRLRRSHAGGEHRTPSRGMSLEFTDYRKYNPGDDFRYIDWNAFSRLERLFLKIFTAEEGISVYLLVDVSGSMGLGKPSKLAHAAKLAMALSYVGIVNYDRVGAVSFSNGINEMLPPVRGRPAIARLYDFFSRMRCGGRTNFNAVVSQFAERSSAPALIFILSDMLDERGCSQGLDLLRYGRNEVVMAHLLADEDVNPSSSGPLFLLDSETGQSKRMVVSSELLTGYRSRFHEFADGVERNCRQRGIEYYRTTTALPVEHLVLRYLRKGRHFR